MSYNFDADRWYERERLRLDKRKADGEVGPEEFDHLAAELERRYEEMVARLDHTFQIPRRQS